MIEMAQRQERPVIMSNASYSFLGRTLVRQAALRGVTTISVVRKAYQVGILEGLGGDYVLDSSAEGYEERLRQVLAETQCRLLVDSVGGDVGTEQWEAMGEGSTLVSIGVMSNKRISLDPRELVFAGKTVTGFHLSRYLKSVDRERLEGELRGIHESQVEWEILGRVRIEEGTEVMRVFREEKRVGKVLLKMGS